MQTSKQEKIDILLEQLETFVKLSYRVNKETDYCNHTYVIKTLKPEYEASKKRLEKTLEELLDINSDT